VRFAVNVQLSDTREPSPLVRQQTPGLEETEVSSDPNPQPTRASGFDPSLLNPLPPADIFSATISPNSGINGVIPPSTGYSLPFEPFTDRESSVDYTSPPRTPVRTAGPSKTFDVPLRTPSPIVIEREPTPHPDFNVDETLLQTLKFQLRERTAHLTVEQLEQLRATCLSCVWRHRAEWNRDGLIRELKEIVNDFIDELVAYDVE
jgi:ATPase family AAA domain-containing protein 2